MLLDVLHAVWDPFEALLKRWGDDLGRLFKMGFGEGGYLAGRVLRHSDEAAEVSYEAIEIIARLGDDLAEAGVELSDEAVQGLAKVVDDAGEGGVERLLRGLNCVTGDCPNLETALRLAGEAAQDWSDEALEGLGRVVRKVGEDGAQRLVDLGGEVSQQAFQVIASKSDNIWNADTVEGLARVFERTPGEKALRFLAREYSDEVVEETLTYIRRADLGATDNVLGRVDDTRDLFQWRAQGNALSVLDDSAISLHRYDMPPGEYLDPGGLKETIQNRWNGGNSIDDWPASRVAEAYAVEGAIDQLQARGYDVVYVCTKEGIQGPDAILKSPSGKWVILEGKGTYTGAALDGSRFDNPPTLGRQLSREWITTDPFRYLDQIDDPVVLSKVEDMLEDITVKGKPYEVVVGRGGIGGSTGNPLPLDYGARLGDFINEIRPSGQEWTIQFIFVRLLK